MNSLLRIKITVARTHCKAVFFSYNRGADYFDVEIKILDHLLDDKELLVILFAENSIMWLYYVKEL